MAVFLLANFLQVQASSAYTGYTLDGNITAGSFLGTGKLTGSKNVTLTGSSVQLNNSINLTGSLAVASTSGDIEINAPSISAQGITLNAAGAVSIINESITTNGGDFSASGNGYTSLLDSNGDSNGVDINGSTINAQGGNVNLVGNAGYTSQNFMEEGTPQTAGSGVAIANGSVIETTGSGNITINSTFNQNISSTGGITAFDLEGGSNSITAASGQISIIGNVVQGTADARLVGGGVGNVAGVLIGGGATVTATGAGGSISLTGYAPAADSIVSGNNLSFSVGVEIDGDGNGAIPLSIGTGGRLTLNGAGGTVDTSNSTITGDNIPFTAGVLLDNGTNFSTGTNTALSITGTGGNVVTTGTFTGTSEGVDIAGTGESLSMDDGSTVNITGFGGAVNAGFDPDGSGSANGINIGGNTGTAIITLNDGGSINLTGTGGFIDTTNATAVGDSFPVALGVDLQAGTQIVANGSTTIAINGTGGSVNAGSGSIGGAAGVLIGGDQVGQSTLVTSEFGAIQITGTGGFTPNFGSGVSIYGFDGGLTTVQSTGGAAITITGTGGSGYTGDGLVNGSSIPNFGVSVVDNASITTGGSISITGTGDSISTGVDIRELTSDPTLDSSPALPSISAGGDFTANALSGTGIFVNANITGATATFGAESTPGDATTITSGSLSFHKAIVTTSGGDVTAFGSGAVSTTSSNVDPDGVDVIDSTINAQGGNISLTGTAGYLFNPNVGIGGGLGGGAGCLYQQRFRRARPC